MELLPLNDFVFVSVPDETEKTAGGLILTTTVKKDVVTSKVVAVGPGFMDHGKVVELQVKVGDEVVFAPSSAKQIELQDVKYYVLREDGIMCVLKK